MSTNIITIGREPGSGGRLIAARLSEKLGYKVYDKNLLNIASRESGLNREFFEKFDEKASFSIFGSWFGMQDNVTDEIIEE
jgi:cytidylate kinase